MQSPQAQLTRTRETSLDPAGVILSLLEELSADEFRRIIGLSGLSVDWQLSKGDSFSHTTRKRAYIPKVQAALGLLAEEDRLQVLAMIATEMRNRPGDLGERMTASLQAIGWHLLDSLQTPAEEHTAPSANTPMTRDKNLVRLLLIQTRDESAPEDLKHFSEGQQVYNAALAIQNGLVEGEAIKDGNGKYVSAVMTNLTSAGHDFLETFETRQEAAMTTIPPEITDSLRRFQNEHPDPSRACFLMMRFGTTKGHNQITDTIKQVLSSCGIQGLRADDKQYNDDVFGNIRTYLHGCGFGIAVFERLEKDDFNPNVSLEVGYLLALGKPVLLLKDKTLQQLHTDLVGKLYRVFDPQDIAATIPIEVAKWMKDKGLVHGPKLSNEIESFDLEKPKNVNPRNTRDSVTSQSRGENRAVPLQIDAIREETPVGNKRYSCKIIVRNIGTATATKVDVQLVDLSPLPSRMYSGGAWQLKLPMLLRAIAATATTGGYINSKSEQQYELLNMIRAGNMPTVQLVSADGKTAAFQADTEGWDGSVPTFKSYAFTIRAVAEGLPDAVQKFRLAFTKDANGIPTFRTEEA
jgi:hypothetical protein